MKTQYNLDRFVKAQRVDYQTALSEIKKGRKRSHWMWYIFPQLKGLGRSPTSEFYGIASLEEAAAFLEDPYLGGNLREICSALTVLTTSNAREVFGVPDDMKLKSSMTLFAHACSSNQIFLDVLEKYFQGQQDTQTLKLLNLR
ncbi:MAG: DUF1810 domain-containing protein [Oscillibacter sp.]|jgi:uncharacterized protein (DUF1810 family)|nr:DUF1810 domain-containing protein [Oscillibacter sp.]